MGKAYNQLLGFHCLIPPSLILLAACYELGLKGVNRTGLNQYNLIQLSPSIVPILVAKVMKVFKIKAYP